MGNPRGGGGGAARMASWRACLVIFLAAVAMDAYSSDIDDIEPVTLEQSKAGPAPPLDEAKSAKAKVVKEAGFKAHVKDKMLGEQENAGRRGGGRCMGPAQLWGRGGISLNRAGNTEDKELGMDDDALDASSA